MQQQKGGPVECLQRKPFSNISTLVMIADTQAYLFDSISIVAWRNYLERLDDSRTSRRIEIQAQKCFYGMREWVRFITRLCVTRSDRDVELRVSVENPRLVWNLNAKEDLYCCVDLEGTVRWMWKRTVRCSWRRRVICSVLRVFSSKEKRER